jgi:preprotein translocase subunit SecA
VDVAVLKGFMSLISGDTNEKEIKRLDVIAKRIIDEFGPKFSNLSNEELRDLTGQFKGRSFAGSLCCCA